MKPWGTTGDGTVSWAWADGESMGLPLGDGSSRMLVGSRQVTQPGMWHAHA